MGSEMRGGRQLQRNRQSRAGAGERGNNKAEERWEEQNGNKAGFKTGKSLLTEILSFLTAQVWFRFVFSSSKQPWAPAAKSRSRPGSGSGPKSWLAPGSCSGLSGRSVCPAADAYPPDRKCPLPEMTGVGLRFRRGGENSPQREREEHRRARARTGIARNRAWPCLPRTPHQAVLATCSPIETSFIGLCLIL